MTTIGGGGAVATANLYAAYREKLATNKRIDLQKDIQNSAKTEGADATDDDSPVAVIQKFAESTDEMSAAMTQFRNRRDYERKMGVQGETSFERILDDEVLSKVEVLVKALSNPGNKTLPQLLQHFRSLFPDDSDLVLVLRELLYRKRLDEVEKKRLEILLKQVEAEANQKSLKAGINVALRARLAGNKLGLKPALLRASYRKFQECDDAEIDIYLDWISLYGPERRHIILEFMEGSLLTDIDAQDPSCSLIEFGYLIGRLGQIKQFRSSEKVFIQELLSKDSVKSHNSCEQDWLLFMICIIQQPESLDEYLKDVLGGAFLLMSHAERSLLMQTIYRACLRLSRDIFYHPEDFERLIHRFNELNNIVYKNERIEQRK